ncbi:MAG: YkvA family protein [Porphyromonas sp.]|nr:YkvA family protein [Porphyromonas sp.]
MKLSYARMAVKSLSDIKSYASHFSEGEWGKKLVQVKHLIGESVLLPMIRLYYVMSSPSTPIGKKIYIAGALGYFILPIDIIPDMLIPVLGFTDDLAVATLVLKLVNNHLTPEIEKKSRRFYDSLVICKRRDKKFLEENQSKKETSKGEENNLSL